MPPQVAARLRYGMLSCHVMELDGCPDLASAVRALPPQAPVIWLDSARTHPITGRWSLLGYRPWLTMTAHGDQLRLQTSAATHAWRGNPLDALRGLLRRYQAPGRRGSLGVLGRAMGLMGFLGYDMNRWIERLPAPQPSGSHVPDMLWFGMGVVILVDHEERRGWAVVVADPHLPGRLADRQAREALEEAAVLLGGAARPGAGEAPQPGAVTATTTQREFERMVARVLEEIRAGDIYQANLSQRFTAPWRGSALSLYLALRGVNPSPFACFLSAGDLAVVSCSPERLVRVQEGRIDTRPIAGTRPRGATADEDALQGLELLLSDKERAEHVMLVDLARNDLGRVCRSGSVAVNDLMGLETYSHVIHIVSDVAGLVRPGADAVEVIRAVFPGGTITGCPKVRCMQLLREIEPVARGLYTGSLGAIGFDGGLDLNIAIRTMVIDGPRLSFHVGAGIVADSIPEREYQETLAKGAALMAALHAAGQPHDDHARAVR